ncbi:drug resistance transporter, EmrB/QacA subfamily [Candidatus Methanoperedens nitroreducens]|uniref:Drug resistance transporter, EmrB/QacA subfamily n=1 Tax=Candidatus Methanoperedens nitratireducens TaxID=1392998 RepID=A0A062V8X8_9EURY|nr:MFS transporter [Candidatus Methanoperedens nitroreducens]KCZ72968.1 drug resistance transporter, EmrB/QacA subfamily [Candidatus Methanoperedens nitroreducens]MDJ1423089.1 MFS transporter [Candidatus Methanoperedens sp.]
MEYKWKAMLTVWIGFFMATLDGSIVNVALPTLTEYFRTDVTTIGWVVMAYLLTITSLLLSLGRLSDMFGRKRIFAAGITIFTIGSGLCAISVTEGQLIFYRVIQGIGAAMLMATGVAIITHAFPPRERGKAMGLIGTVVAIGSMAGPVTGGFLIENVGWQSIFYINIPVGLFGTAMALRVLKKDETTIGQTFDIPGALTLFISLVSLLLALSHGQKLGWGSKYIILLFILSAASFIIFIIVETRARHPMMELRHFRNRPFAAANISALISFTAMFSVIFLMPFFLERELGYSPQEVGIMFLAVPLIMSVVAPISGWLSDRTNSYILSSTGVGISSLSILSLSFMSSSSDFIDVSSRLALFGLGMGLFQAPNNSIIMGSLPKEQLGIAAGTMGTMRNMGMVIGVAISGAVFSSRHVYYGGIDSSFLPAFRDTYIVAAVICGIAMVTSLIRSKGK